MAKVIIDDKNLFDIADAIRGKNGTTYSYKPKEMATAISALSGNDDVASSIIRKNIVEINSDVEHIGKYAFCDCTLLSTVNFPFATTISDFAFDGCRALTTVNCSRAQYIQSCAFRDCTQLSDINFPSVEKIGEGAFARCVNLKTAEFQSVRKIEEAFFECSNLRTLILRTSEVVELTSEYAFLHSGLDSGICYIYVPSALLDAYKIAENWNIYANCFRAIEDYPEFGGEKL